jgi:dTDP-glucose 4,6-dehydratase
MEVRFTPIKRVLVTGGLGFIGARFIRHIIRRDVTVLNLDLNTYAADERRLAVSAAYRVQTSHCDVSDGSAARIVKEFQPQLVVHFAAESHVTRSERQAQTFHRSNVEGTRMMLDASVAAGVPLFVHISTDEVYGPCFGKPFSEEDKEPGEGKATSHYAKSKALADDLAMSYSQRIPLAVVRPTNCFGPWQHAEKAIPRWIIRALVDRRMPVWGDGQQVRDWMYVDDACSGIETVIERGAVGQAYNLAPQGAQRTNLEIARLISRIVTGSEDAVYLTQYDRPDHDRRYAIDASKIHALGWQPSVELEMGLRKTVTWYRRNREWWTGLIAEAEQLYDDASERSTTL